MKDTILLVDDEAHVLSALTRALADDQYEILTASGGRQALEIIAGATVKAIISDECMIGMQGSELLAEVKQCSPHTVRILLTGHATLEAAKRAVNEGEIYRFFTKPWDDVQIRLALLSAVEKYNLEAEIRRLLVTVKNQAMELKILERRYPGISRVQKDAAGIFVLPEIDDDEIATLMAECEREFDTR